MPQRRSADDKLGVSETRSGPFPGSGRGPQAALLGSPVLPEPGWRDQMVNGFLLASVTLCFMGTIIFAALIHLLLLYDLLGGVVLLLLLALGFCFALLGWFAVSVLRTRVVRWRRLPDRARAEGALGR